MSDRVHSGSPYEEAYGFCRARRMGALIMVSGTAPIAAPGEDIEPSAHDQMMRCGEIAIAAVEKLGGRADQVVRTRMYITDPAAQDEVGRAHRMLFGAAEPVSTMVVAQLLDPSWLVELEVEALVR